MHQHRGRNLLTLAVLLPLLATAGCTGTDFLNPGNFTVQFIGSVTASDSSSPDWECVTIKFDRILLAPTDPESADTFTIGDQVVPAAVMLQADGGYINLSNNPCNVPPDSPLGLALGLNNEIPGLPSTFLASGGYRLQELAVGQINMWDPDEPEHPFGPDTPQVSCFDVPRTVCGDDLPGIQRCEEAFPGSVFTVADGLPNTMIFTLNVSTTALAYSNPFFNACNPPLFSNPETLLSVSYQ